MIIPNQKFFALISVLGDAKYPLLQIIFLWCHAKNCSDINIINQHNLRNMTRVKCLGGHDFLISFSDPQAHVMPPEVVSARN